MLLRKTKQQRMDQSDVESIKSTIGTSEGKQKGKKKELDKEEGKAIPIPKSVSDVLKRTSTGSGSSQGHLKRRPAEPAGPPPSKKPKTEGSSYKWEDKGDKDRSHSCWEERGKNDRQCFHCLGFDHSAAGCPRMYREALEDYGKADMPTDADIRRYNIPIYCKFCFRRVQSEK